ncbi:unnamed protein product [Diatraea saccharalis]|uniref:Salivary secreted peptide n=1 Tax=Diatraea saccharalis TaxID=40085 RepID=A0A9N9W779_9NEOP|nr:unnamed protein product [Diatraea saccharalis]
MGAITYSAFFFCVLFVAVSTYDLQAGSSINGTLVYVESVNLSSIPLKVRTKNVFYNDNSTIPRAIKGISAIDMKRSKAKATITSGGVGSTFVNIKLKSSRGDGLTYQVQVFA